MSERNFAVGEKVLHRKLGVGEIVAAGEGRVVVRFGTQERVFVPEIAPLTKIDAAKNVYG